MAPAEVKVCRPQRHWIWIDVEALLAYVLLSLAFEALLYPHDPIAARLPRLAYGAFILGLVLALNTGLHSRYGRRAMVVRSIVWMGVATVLWLSHSWS